MSLADLYFNYPGGKSRVILVESSDGGSETIDLRPPPSKKWWVLYCFAYHDGDGNASIDWQWTDGVTTIQRPSPAIPPNTPYPLVGAIITQSGSRNVECSQIVSRGVYPQLVVPALGAGNFAYIHAVVLEIDDCVDPD